MDNRFRALDGLRGVSALFVVIFHMDWLGSVTGLAYSRGSFLFVEFFFALSGFVLAHRFHIKERGRFILFMKGRFFRLYPLHFAMFVLVILYQFIHILAIKYAGISFWIEPFTLKYSLDEVIPHLLLIQSWSSSFSSVSFNGSAWSISIEFYMYALLFISIVLSKSHKAWVWMTVSLITFVLLYTKSQAIPPEVLRGLSCFFGGTVIYSVYLNLKEVKLSYVTGSFVELFCIILVVLIVQSSLEQRPIIASCLFLFAVLLFAFESGCISSLLLSRSLQTLGVLSYSIYLTHGVLLLYFRALLTMLDKHVAIELMPVIDGVRYMNFGSTMANNFGVLLILTLSIVVSFFTYKHIELKGLQLGRPKLGLRKAY